MVDLAPLALAVLPQDLKAITLNRNFELYNFTQGVPQPLAQVVLPQQENSAALRGLLPVTLEENIQNNR